MDDEDCEEEDERTNQGPVLRSRDSQGPIRGQYDDERNGPDPVYTISNDLRLQGPIRGQYAGHVTYKDQSEARDINQWMESQAYTR